MEVDSALPRRWLRTTRGTRININVPGVKLHNAMDVNTRNLLFSQGKIGEKGTDDAQTGRGILGLRRALVL